jgi:MFS family permease
MADRRAGTEATRKVKAFLGATIASTFFIGVTFGLGYPLASLTFEAWGQPSWILGTAGAAPSVGIVLSVLVLPRLIARLGAVPALVTGCLLSATGYLALSALTGPWSWIAVRFLMGAFVTIPWLIVQVWTTTAAPAHISGRVLAAYSLAFAGGTAISPVLVEAMGFQGPLPFVAGAVLAVLVILPILMVARSAPHAEFKPITGIASMVRTVPLTVVTGYLSGFMELSTVSLITSVAIAGGLEVVPALRLVTAFLAGCTVMQIPLGWLADRMRPFGISIALCLLDAAAVLALPWVLPHFAAAAAIAFLMGGASYGFYTLSMALIGEHGEPADHNTGNVAVIMGSQTGGVVGPLMCGAAMTQATVAGFVGVIVFANLATAIALVAINRAQPKAAR